MIYGNLPTDLGLVDISPTEMMFWLYCPIKEPYGQFIIPPNLRQFQPILEKVCSTEYIGSSYVYLTTKTLYIEPKSVGNRPGWHTDGFGTDDINFIWYDRCPTLFLATNLDLPDKCEDAMKQMEERAKGHANICYPDKHLLRLDQTVIHHIPMHIDPGMRTFVKVSISKDKYNLEGNSVNHKLKLNVDLKPRNVDRNHPCQDFEPA